MAVLTAGTAGPVDLTAFDIVDFTNTTTHDVNQTATAYRLTDQSDPGTYNEFVGTGFTAGATDLTTGTISEIAVFSSGVLVYRITGLSFDASQLAGFISSSSGSEDFIATLFAGADSMSSGANSDTLFGGDGNDTLVAGTGADSLDGGEGSDTYRIDDAKAVFDDSGSNKDIDTVISSVSLSLDKNSTIENLTLVGKAVSGTGNSGDNVILGNANNNTLDGGIGDDTMDGGAGADTYIVDSQDDKVSESAQGPVTEKDQVLTTVSFTLSDNIENLTFIGGQGTGTGNALANLMKGDIGDDRLIGLGGNDTLEGGAGNDTLDGGTGFDRMVGGSGDDDYFVDSLSDVIVEGNGQGRDTVHSSITYTLSANLNDLVLVGTANINGTGNDSANLIVGNTGDNSLSGGFGNDTLEGGAGNDSYFVEFQGDKIVEEDKGGYDVLRSSYSFDLSTNGANVEELILLSDIHAFNAIGNDIDNKITGNQFNNLIDGRAGKDTLIGAGGDDTYMVDDAGDVVTDSSGLNDTVISTVAFSAPLQGIEHYTFKITQALNFTGTSVANRIISGSGDDSVAGLAGNDTLDGGAGKDTLEGGSGNDTYVIDNVDDKVIETGADTGDTVVASINLDLTKFANIENGGLNGIASADIVGTTGNNILTGNDNDSVPADKGGNPEGTGNNKLEGAAGNDTVFGLGGKDTLDGGQGADSMVGGKGDDTYFVDNIGDRINELPDPTVEGRDTVRSTINYVLGINLEVLDLIGGDLNGTGNGVSNLIFGTDGKNVLDGGFASDTLIGGKGDDIYIFDSAGDSTVLRDDKGEILLSEASDKGGGGYDIVKSSADCVLGGGIEELILTGTFNISGTGDDGDDKITGNSGNNKLDGGVGADTMIGGLGDDSYVLDDAGDQFIDSGGANDELIVAFDDFVVIRNLSTLYVGFESYDFTKYGKAAIDIAGDKANNLLVGTDKFDDTISGNEGNDTLSGGKGADSLSGGIGNDRYIIDDVGDRVSELPGAGTDTIESHLTSFSLEGPEYANIENLALGDTLFAKNATGNKLANVITGNNASNQLSGLDGNDTIIGDNGDDTIDGGTGFDSMAGGGGSDTYIVDTLSDRVSELKDQGLHDTIVTNLTYTLGLYFEDLVLTGTGKVNGTGNAAANTITGNDQDNLLSGGDGDDTLIGGGGNDTLNGGYLDADKMVGGTGNDTYYIESRFDGVVEEQGEGYDTVIATPLFGGGGIGLLTLAGEIEKIIINGSAGYQLIANEYDNLIVASAGSDSIMAGGGNDTVQGNAGNDTLVGSDGADRLDGGTGADSMQGGTGDDTYVVDSLNDVVQEFGPGGGVDTLESSIAIDVTKYNFIEYFVLTGTGALTAIGDSTDNNLTGNDGANLLTGNGGDDTLAGGKGNDTLDGGAGVDSLVGGLGNDTFLVDDPADAVKEAFGEGTDVVKSTATSYTLSDNVENLILLAPAANGTGNGLSNAITGNDLGNILDGGVGTDTLTGGKGDDVYVVDNTKDVVTETLTSAQGGGHDRVDSSVTWTLGTNVEDLKLTGAGAIDGTGNTADNALTGNDNNNKLAGLVGNDTIDGGAGEDTLTGGAGNDSLVGGIGTDRAVFSGKFADYLITTDDKTGVTTVVDKNGAVNGDDGTDKLFSIEVLQFADKTLPIGKDPVIISDGGGDKAVVNAAENQTAVTKVVAADVDTLTYSIVGGADKDAFVIDSATGVLTFKNAPDFESPTDAGNDNIYDVTVQVSDGNGGFDTQDISVSVADVNETPSITSDGGGDKADLAIDENQTAVTKVTAADPDAGSHLTFTVIGGADKNAFVIDPDTGVLSFKTAPDFETPTDVGKNHVYDVVVQVSDGKLTDTQTISVTIKDINDAPVITSSGGGDKAAIDIDENQTLVTKVTAADQDHDQLTFTIVGGADKDAFVIDPDTGVLTFKTAPDFENPTDDGKDNVYDVVVRASDGSLSDDQAIAVSVNGINEAPVITSSATATVLENQTAAIDINADDPDNDTLTYSLLASADRGLFSIDSSTGVITFNKAPDYETPGDADTDNKYELSVKVSDGHGGVDVQDITITVINENDAPVITSAATISVQENQTAAIDVNADDQDKDILTYSLLASADKDLFSIDGSTGLITFNKGPDYETPGDANSDNKYELSVQVSDGHGGFDVQDITVTVTNVNDAPVITSTATISVQENQTAAIDVDASDQDLNTLTYSLLASADKDLFSINAGTGLITFKAAPDYETPGDAGGDNKYELTVQVADGKGGFDTQNITVAVTNVDEGPGPIIDQDGAIGGSVDENAADGTSVGIMAHADDPEGDSITYSLTDNADGRFAINATTGEVTVANGRLLDFEAASSHTIAVQASSSGGTSTHAFTITVGNVTPENVTGDSMANKFIGGTGDDTFNGAGGDDTLTGGAGSDVFLYTNPVDGHDVITDFTGGQDVLDLDQLFDGLGGVTARADRVNIVDNGGSVDVQVDTDDNIGNGFELTVATLTTADPITVGTDVLVGS